MQKSLKSTINNYNIADLIQRKSVSTNSPLTALFGSLKSNQTKTSIEFIEKSKMRKKVARDLKNRKLKATSQLQLVMDVKNEFMSEIMKLRINA